MFDPVAVDTLIEEFRGFSSEAMEYLNQLALKDLYALPFSDKAVDIFDLCDLYPDVFEVSPLIAYFVLSRCHYLRDELTTEIVIIKNALEARTKRGVTSPLDARKILKYWQDTAKGKYLVDFRAIQSKLSQETVAEVIGEFRDSIDYDNMPEDMQTVAKALLDELLTEPAEMQLLIVRGILCITVED